VDLVVSAAVEGAPEKLVGLRAAWLRVFVAFLGAASKTAMLFRFAQAATPIARASAIATAILVVRGALSVQLSFVAHWRV
jgi:hypothetical protein